MSDCIPGARQDCASMLAPSSWDAENSVCVAALMVQQGIMQYTNPSVVVLST